MVGQDPHDRSPYVVHDPHSGSRPHGGLVAMVGHDPHSGSRPHSGLGAMVGHDPIVG